MRGIAVGLDSDSSNKLQELIDSAVTSITYSGGVLKWEGLAGQKGTATLLGSTAPKAAGTAAAGSSTQAARADHVHPQQSTVSGNAGSATKLATKRVIDGVNFDGTASVLHYAACSTAAATAAKAVSISNFTLTTGAYVLVKFSSTNTAAVASLTLNVSSTGAKSIKYRGGNLPSAGTLAANRVYFFVFDGNNWNLVGDLDTNTTYSAATQSAAGLMSAADKQKLDGIATGATKVIVDNSPSPTSGNPLANRAIIQIQNSLLEQINALKDQIANSRIVIPYEIYSLATGTQLADSHFSATEWKTLSAFKTALEQFNQYGTAVYVELGNSSSNTRITHAVFQYRENTAGKYYTFAFSTSTSNVGDLSARLNFNLTKSTGVLLFGKAGV